MKKTLVSALVLSAISSTATAGFKVDLNNESKLEGERASKQTVVLGYSHETNVGTGFGEVELNNKKDVDLTFGWVLPISETFYAKPTLGYLVKGGDNKKNAELLKAHGVDLGHGYSGNAGLDYEETGINSNVMKLGIELGANFDNGFFASARYRVELDQEAHEGKLKGYARITDMAVEYSDPDVVWERKGEHTLFKNHKSKIGRTDLTAGYNFEFLTLQAKAIHKDQLSKKYENQNGKKPAWSSELKATVTAFDGVAPYLELSSGHTHREGFDDNKVKLGVAFTF